MRKTYKIEIDCPNCAAHLEQAIGKLSGVETAVVNFMTQKLTVTFAPDADPEAVMAEADKACRKATSHGKIYL